MTYTEILARNLKVMDAAAISLARDNNLPVLVFSLHEEGSLSAALLGEGRSTLITEGDDHG